MIRFNTIIIMIISQTALASNDPVGDALCALIDFFAANGFLYVICLSAITILGFLFLRGTINPYTALIVFTGIIIIFYSREILIMFGGSKNFCVGTQTTSESPFVDALCHVIAVLRTTTMRAIEVVAIMVMGIQYFRGKLDWGKTLIISLGIIIMVAAPDIVLKLITDSGHKSDSFGKACYNIK